MTHLIGIHLNLALDRTGSKPIRLNSLDGEKLTAEEVQILLERGYEAHGTNRRVKYLCSPRPRAYVDRRKFERNDAFWAGRGCIRFWADQISPGMQSRLSA